MTRIRDAWAVLRGRSIAVRKMPPTYLNWYGRDGKRIDFDWTTTSIGGDLRVGGDLTISGDIS